jgi:hypothetical protein
MLANKALSAAPSAVPAYIEDVFSTYLWEGNATARNIVNGIDLAGKGGMVWTKYRNTTNNHRLYDTARGATKEIYSSLTNAESTASQSLTAFNADGFSLGTGQPNENTATVVGWTFAQQEKFFDVVTYTGNGTAGRTISHNLGSTPGCIIVKSTSGSDAWIVWHRSANSGTGNAYGQLAATNSFSADNGTFWGSGSYTAPTSTTFTVSDHSAVNGNGATYVAYLFAHDAGGFGASGSDNVISCGGFTTDSGGAATITLGYEPQWVLYKKTDSSSGGDTGNWRLQDNMRGLVVGGNDSVLFPNTSGAETTDSDWIQPNSTGFRVDANASANYIYIAIRKGPMKTPTTGTSIFTPTAFSGNDTSGTRSAGLNAFDLLIAKRTASSSLDWVWLDKLRGLAGDRWITSNSTNYEKASGSTLDTINTINGQYTQDGINITKTSNYSYLDAGSSNYIWYALKRAPGFFDEVCYTGTGSAGLSVSHNLGVVPELIIVKRRDASVNWAVGTQFGASDFTFAFLNTTGAGFVNQGYNTSYGFYAKPTTSAFTLDTASSVNSSTGIYVAYLFASLTGVSKVGSYTGNGSSQTINCGFTGGARFVLIKRTDSTGDWYVYDTARGIVSGNDSQLKLNTDATAATGFDAVDLDNSGFIVNNDATNFPINVNAATYIYLAIA